MTDRALGSPDELRTAVDTRQPYVRPEITRLGSLDELTLGGTQGPDDGNGGAGSTGNSI